MSSEESPFRNTHPSFDSGVLELAHAIVYEQPIPPALLDALPVNLKIRKTLHALKSLAQAQWLATEAIEAFVKLMPSSHNSCIVLL